jgi:hypothetical protein
MNRIINDIIYDHETTYIGRNGMGRQKGLGLTANSNTILLEPINSKDHLANCQIRIPYANISDVIYELTKLLYQLSE